MRRNSYKSRAKPPRTPEPPAPSGKACEPSTSFKSSSTSEHKPGLNEPRQVCGRVSVLWFTLETPMNCPGSEARRLAALPAMQYDGAEKSAGADTCDRPNIGTATPHGRAARVQATPAVTARSRDLQSSVGR